uniref:Secreted protein n=1 Tax=Ixodes ricinus TaxID=34613 RepID=A0A6B0V9E5_IXORI
MWDATGYLTQLACLLLGTRCPAVVFRTVLQDGWVHVVVAVLQRRTDPSPSLEGHRRGPRRARRTLSRTWHVDGRRRKRVGCLFGALARGASLEELDGGLLGPSVLTGGLGLQQQLLEIQQTGRLDRSESVVGERPSLHRARRADQRDVSGPTAAVAGTSWTQEASFGESAPARCAGPAADHGRTGPRRQWRLRQVNLGFDSVLLLRRVDDSKQVLCGHWLPSELSSDGRAAAAVVRRSFGARAGQAGGRESGRRASLRQPTEGGVTLLVRALSRRWGQVGVLAVVRISKAVRVRRRIVGRHSFGPREDEGTLLGAPVIPFRAPLVRTVRRRRGTCSHRPHILPANVRGSD